MKKSVVLSALVLGVLVCSGLAQAQHRGVNANQRVGPENFGPLGGQFCDTPNLPFGPPASVSDTISVTGQDAITVLDVELQIAHSWVGDITATLTHVDTATTQILIDRPGVPALGACGCSFDDVDVTLSQTGSGPVENACSAAIPAIGGTLIPGPGNLGAFTGQDGDGTWSMTIADGFPASDAGTFIGWCLNFGGSTTGGTGGTGGATGGTGGTPTPATSTWGVILLIALFLGASMFFLRRRGSANA